VEPGDVKEAARYAWCRTPGNANLLIGAGAPGSVWEFGSWGCLFRLGSRADRDREMGKIAHINAKKKFCANDVIPAYENYYKRVLNES
jgi:hypothetical protein